MADEPTDTETAHDPETGSVAARRPLPRWAALVFFAICLGVIPQILHLSSSLNEVALANHWRTVWIGLDIAEAVVFFLTAWFLFRRSIFVTVTASMAAAMLWMDAWFDVLTSVRQTDIDSATYLAAFVEVPLGLFCLYVALRSLWAFKPPQQAVEE